MSSLRPNPTRARPRAGWCRGLLPGLLLALSVCGAAAPPEPGSRSPRLRTQALAFRPGAASPDRKAQLAEGRRVLQGVPLFFEANRGQASPEARYVARAAGCELEIGPTQAVLSPRESLLERKRAGAKSGAGALRLRFLGADPGAGVAGEEPLPGKVHYYRGSDPARWQQHVPTYAKVRCRSVYPGIDLLYYGRGRALEYDFILGPGVDPGAIRIALDGARSVEVDAAGDLVVRLEKGRVRQRRPVVYQERDGRRQEVPARYLLARAPAGAGGGSSTPIVAFQVGEYDGTRPLIIDPVLSYSTYLGDGAGLDVVRDIALDGFGEAFVVGTDGTGDAFVARLRLSQVGAASLLYLTRVGGDDADEGRGIDRQSAPFVTITGKTLSQNLPVVSAVQQSNAGGADAFVARFNPDTGALRTCTYLGGSGNDEGNAVAQGTANLGSAVWVVGTTTSADLPVPELPLLPIPFQRNKAAGQDAFVAEYSPSEDPLEADLHVTYLGGNGDDQGLDINVAKIDGVSRPIVTGRTTSTNFPTRAPGALVRPFQQDQGGMDAFVTRLSVGLGNAVYSTYLGGGGTEIGNSIDVDGQGNAWVTGVTGSSDFPTTGNAFARAVTGPNDAFVAKVSGDGSQLLYGTYLGGEATDSGGAIDLAGDGSVWVTGLTTSRGFPIVNPIQSLIQPLPAPPADAFVTQILPAGSLGFSSYLGGRALDEGFGIKVDPDGDVCVVGRTFSSDFPTTASAVQPEFGGGTQPDGWVARLGPGRVILTPGIGGFWSSLRQVRTGSGAGARYSLDGILYLQSAGRTAFPASVLRVFLSTDARLDARDTLLQELPVPRLGSGKVHVLRVRTNLRGPATGRFAIAFADATNVVRNEPNEANNVIPFGPIR